jgi:hypothetical protein
MSHSGLTAYHGTTQLPASFTYTKPLPVPDVYDLPRKYAKAPR